MLSHDMQTRLRAAQQELDRRRELVDLQIRVRDQIIKAAEAEGASTRQIAAALGLTEGSVRKALLAA